jgi:hypothetical protein
MLGWLQAEIGRGFRLVEGVRAAVTSGALGYGVLVGRHR